MSARDYYYFDHGVETSNYWGIYELGFGLNINKKDISKFVPYLDVSLDFAERFYLLDLNNDDPYSFANGQGWFGIDSEKWTKGDPFSGFRSRGHVFTLKAELGILKYFFVYQKFIIEIVDRREDHNEFNLILGSGGIY